MKILHIISQAPDFTGSGKFIQQIILKAGAGGHENFLVAAVQPGCDIPCDLISLDHAVFVEFAGKDLDFPIPGMSDAMPYESTVFSKMSPKNLLAYQRVFKKKIQEALDRFQPDLMHTHHLWIVSALARQLAPDLPMVTTCHGTCLRQHIFCPWIGREMIGPLQQIDRIMALSQSQKQEVVDLLGLGPVPDRVPVVTGGYDHTLFQYRTKPENGVVELLYAGKLCRAKGVPWLLRSLDKISNMPFRLHLAGSGPEAEMGACMELAATLGPRAVWHGPLSHRDLAKLMGACHLFVLPSFFEGVPLVLMEALACGCRLLSTDLPGVLDILSPADRRMVYFLNLPVLKNMDTPHEQDEEDLEERLAMALKKIMEEILENPAPDVRTIERRTCPYTWEKVFDRIESIYLSLTAPEVSDEGKR
ncbi:MAG: glycosyltransferase family 4 protein [Proteobacteria bacterium]|nr:glycosyltransferase family 4 protein [Pseudomonadota bacterium]